MAKRAAAGAAEAEAHTALEPRCADRRRAQPALPVKAAWLRGRARDAVVRDWPAALLAPRAVTRGEDVQRMERHFRTGCGARDGACDLALRTVPLARAYEGVHRTMLHTPPVLSPFCASLLPLACPATILSKT